MSFPLQLDRQVIQHILRLIISLLMLQPLLMLHLYGRHRLIDFEPLPPRTSVVSLSPIRIAGNECGQFGKEADAESTVLLNVVGPEPDEDTRGFGIGLRNVAHLAVALRNVSLVDANGVHPKHKRLIGPSQILQCRMQVFGNVDGASWRRPVGREDVQRFWKLGLAPRI